MKFMNLIFLVSILMIVNQPYAQDFDDGLPDVEKQQKSEELFKNFNRQLNKSNKCRVDKDCVSVYLSCPLVKEQTN